jgi:hypothetical protein
MSRRDEIITILRSRIDTYSGSDDIAPHVTNAEQVADLILSLDPPAPVPEPVLVPTKLRSIAAFCPPGTQIRSPGGLAIDTSQICSVESYGGRDGYIVLHMPNSTIKITFYDNVYGGPPDVHRVAAALQGKKWP